MDTVVPFLLVASILTFVAWPFFASSDIGGSEEDNISPLERQKLDAMTAIKEAEFDLRTGKLSDADFAALNDKYRKQALSAISAIEALRARAKDPKGAGSSRRISFCPQCGEKLPERGKFCAGCGRSLQQAA